MDTSSEPNETIVKIQDTDPQVEGSCTMEFGFKTKISAQRADVVRREIADGSEPGGRFYTMVAISTIIASFGLVMNSTAVVIGAMLVAPLMTPVFGVSLALLQGDASLLGRAVRAEIFGVVLAIAMAALLANLVPGLQPTDEMLRRTHPNLFDLFVAVFAGMAGAYALVDEKISPALPGVAIATSIVPPLANSGLCIALGAFKGAIGSFLLFFANFLSILIVAAVIFFFSGLTHRAESLKRIELVKRFNLAIIGFFLITAFLSYELYRMSYMRETSEKIQSVINLAFLDIPSAAVRKVAFQRNKDGFVVLARVESPKTIRSSKIKEIEIRLAEALNRPVELILRKTFTEEVSSSGAVDTMIVETLDGFKYLQGQDPAIRKAKLAEQTIRDYLAAQLGLELYDTDYLFRDDNPVIAATIAGLRKLEMSEVRKIEKQIQDKLDDDSVHLVIRHIPVQLYDRWGEFRFNWIDYEAPNNKKKEIMEQLFRISHKELESRGYHINGLSLKTVDGIYRVLVEVSGVKSFSQEDLAVLKGKISKTLNVPMRLYVHPRRDVLVSEEGFVPFEMYNEAFITHKNSADREKIKTLIEETL